MSLIPLPTSRGRAGSTAWAGRLIELPVRFPRVVRISALALAVGAVVLLPQARFDNNPLNVRDPSSESVKTLKELLERGTNSPWTMNALAPDVGSARALAAELEKLESVDKVVTLADFVPEDQQEKLDIIEEVALFLGPVAPNGSEIGPDDAERLESLRHLEAELGKLDGSRLPPDFAATVTLLRANLARYLEGLETSENPTASLDALEQSLLGSLPEQLRILSAALGAGHVTLENLPDALLAQMIGEDGQARVRIFPSDDLKDNEALATFVDEVRVIAPDAAGSAAEMLGSGRAVVAALRQALLSALVAVTAVVFLVWRRLTDTALVLIPLGLATAFTVATAVLLGIPFNFADVIVLPLLLGIGVDSGIHLVHRARLSEFEAPNLLGTSTARAVAFSALTTIASFGTMGLATHRGLATLGQLLTLGVGFTLLCNLVVLPSLISLRDRREPAPLVTGESHG